MAIPTLICPNSNLPAQIQELQDEFHQVMAEESNLTIITMALQRIEEKAHSMVSARVKNRKWYLLDNGWIFKFKGRWHWVDIPGTNQNGIEVFPSEEELAFQRGKGRNKYIIRSDGSMLVQFTHHSQSRKAPKVGWYYLYEGEYPELDEFI